MEKLDAVVTIGSLPLMIVVNPENNVDFAVKLSKNCFREKDFLNYRYHSKRIHYLICLARRISQSSHFKRIELTFLKNDASKPIISLVRDANGDSPPFPSVLRLIPTIDWDTFDVSKLLPGRNNVRSVKSKDDKLLPTPHYNASILEDMALKDCHDWLQACLKDKDALREAIVLLKVWCRQREYDQRVDSVDENHVAFLAAHLSTSGGGNRLNKAMNSPQVFRIIMDILGNHDTLLKGIFLQNPDGTANALQAKGRQAMLKAYNAVICEPLGRFNLAYRVSKTAIAELKDSALMTLMSLKSDTISAFDAIFMTKVDFASKFDFHIRFVLPSSAQTERFQDRHRQQADEAQAERIFTRALGDRARLVRVISRGKTGSFSLEKGVKDGPSVVVIGVQAAEPEVAFRLVDIGPLADNKEEAKKFRGFWGAKSELRRFKDSRISESVVWESPPDSRHLIVEQIVKAVANRHLKLDASQVFVSGRQLDCVLPPVTDEPMSLKLQQAFESFSQTLRTMDALPLKVVGVQPLNSGLCQTSVFPAHPHPLCFPGRSIPPSLLRVKQVPSCVEPIEVALQFEGSGKWPDDPEALQKTKMAFLLQVAESLEASQGAKTMATESTVDVLMLGFAFRLLVAYDRDPTFVQSNTGPKHLSRRLPDSPHDDIALRSAHWSHVQSLSGVQALLSPVTRLAKRWISSHLFSGVVCKEAVELLVAYLFTNSPPFGPPRSPITGFLRFLRLLCCHDWANLPLIVDFTNELTEEDYREIQENFDSSRKQENKASIKSAMFIATKYDRSSQTWTHLSPSAKALKRLVSYAKSSANLLTKLINDGRESLQWQSLFCTPLSLFDAVILLDGRNLPFPSRTVFPAHETLGVPLPEGPTDGWNLVKKGTNLKTVDVKECLFVGFDPLLMCISKLKGKFGGLADFWYDSNGGTAVGITWKDLKAKAVKKSPYVSKKRKKDGDSATESSSQTVDYEAILRDVVAVGGGLFDRIHVTEKK